MRSSVCVFLISCYLPYILSDPLDPCGNYTNITSDIIASGQPCNFSLLTTGWYRYTNNSDGSLLNRCPTTRTDVAYAIWMNDTVPGVDEGGKKVNICLQDNTDCCSRSNVLDMKNCSSFIVIHHRKLPPLSCPIIYAFQPFPTNSTIPSVATLKSTETTARRSSATPFQKTSVRPTSMTSSATITTVTQSTVQSATLTTSVTQSTVPFATLTTSVAQSTTSSTTVTTTKETHSKSSTATKNPTTKDMSISISSRRASRPPLTSSTLDLHTTGNVDEFSSTKEASVSPVTTTPAPSSNSSKKLAVIIGASVGGLVLIVVVVIIAIISRRMQQDDGITTLQWKKKKEGRSKSVRMEPIYLTTRLRKQILTAFLVNAFWLLCRCILVIM